VGIVLQTEDELGKPIIAIAPRGYPKSGFGNGDSLGRARRGVISLRLLSGCIHGDGPSYSDIHAIRIIHSDPRSSSSKVRWRTNCRAATVVRVGTLSPRRAGAVTSTTTTK